MKFKLNAKNRRVEDAENRRDNFLRLSHSERFSLVFLFFLFEISNLKFSNNQEALFLSAVLCVYHPPATSTRHHIH